MFRLFTGSARLSARSLPRSARIIPFKTYWWSASPPAAIVLAENAMPQIESTLLPYLLAIVLTATAVEAIDVNYYEVKKVEGKGLAAFATRDIPIGTKILAERPLAVWPQGLTSKAASELYELFTPEQKIVFLGLCKAENLEDEVLSRRAANGFAVSLPELSEGMVGVPGSQRKVLSFIFPKVARFNHSCLPNSSQAVDFETLRMEIYAIRPIAEGEEIQIEYLPNLTTKTRAERQLELKNSFGFSNCLCALCGSSEEEVMKSDARRVEIRKIVEVIEGNEGDRKEKMAGLERMRVLLEEDGYHGPAEFNSIDVSNAFALYLQMHASTR